LSGGRGIRAVNQKRPPRLPESKVTTVAVLVCGYALYAPITL